MVIPVKSFVKNEFDSENAIFSCRLGNDFAAFWCVQNFDLCSYSDVEPIMKLLLGFDHFY